MQLLHFYQKQKINLEEKILGVETQSSFPLIQEIMDVKEPYDKLWRSVVRFNEKQEKWLNASLITLDAEDIEEEVNNR